ncbi:MAG: sulfatase [Candidatus Sumerlaeota bacterium]|nr:sulfatase [Candidatus Sumerlaeota bacterium]
MTAKLTRREWLAKFGGWGAGAAAACALPQFLRAADAPPRRPNILYIMSDDHARHAVSCYGSRLNQTPNIDRIAREGVRFDNAFVTNSLCAPSRAVLLSGKYSHLNGQLDNGGGFHPDQTMFSELMQKAGYQTAVVGKWHLKVDPKGFDYWNMLPGQGVYNNPLTIENGQPKKNHGYVTDIIADSAIDFLQRCSKERPFCLLVHNKAPHRPWTPDKAQAALFPDEDLPEPDTFHDDYSTRSSAARHAAMRVADNLGKSDLKASPPPGLTPEELTHWKYERFISDYLRCVASVDENVGRMLKCLEELGQLGNTIVIYTSDQGFFLGDHGWFDKRFIYDESQRIPLVARYPAEIKPGSVNADIVLNLDFAPTFLDFAGVPKPSDMQGRSLRPLMQGKTPRDWRQSMYYHYYEYPGGHLVYRHRGVRTKQYLLIQFYGTNEWEFYDLAKDPHELDNVYDDPAYAEQVSALKAEMERLAAQYKDDSVDPTYLDKIEARSAKRAKPAAKGLKSDPERKRAKQASHAFREAQEARPGPA